MKTKDRLNRSCGEPESCYFRESGEKGLAKLVSSAGWSEDQRLIEPVVWRTRVGLLQEEWRERNSWNDCMRSQSCLLQNVNHRIANSEGFPSKIEKLSEGERTNPRQSSSEGEAFFLSWVRRATKFFWCLTYSEEEKKTEREKGVTVGPQTWPSSKTRSAMYQSQ